jgi:hypothetical protein
MSEIDILSVTVKFKPPATGEWSTTAYEATMVRGKESKFFYAPTPEIALAKALAALMERAAKAVA